MKTIFNDKDYSELLKRAESLQPDSPRQWGKMNVAQMMAHVSRTIELSLGLASAPSESNFIFRWFLKPLVVGPRPVKKNSPTSKAFLITDEREFQIENPRLLENLRAAKARGPHGQWSPSVAFGPLTPDEWGRLTYKHMDHHLRQFAV